MTKEGDRQHAEYIEGYLQRESVQKYLKEQTENRRARLEQVQYKGRRVFGSPSTKVLLSFGAFFDQAGMILEAEAEADYKGYTFK